MTLGHDMKNAGMFAAVFAFIAACLAVVGLSYIMEVRVETMENERAALEREYAILTAEINTLMTQKRLISAAVEDLKMYGHAPLTRLSFYAALREIALDSDVEIISTHWNGEPAEQNGHCSMTLALRGDYYGIMRMMAACRNMAIPVRAAGLTVLPLPSGEISSEITLEAILSVR